MTVMLKRRTTRRPVRAGQGPTASPLLCALLCSVAMAGCSGDDPDGSAVSGTPPVAGLPGDDPGTVEPPSGIPPGTTAPGSGAAGVQPVDPPAALVPDATDLAPSAAPYRTDGYGQGGVIRADVRTVTGTGPCTEDDQSGCTFDDLRADVDNTDDFKVTLPAHFAADDFPDDGTAINATLRQRGNSARAAEQKSFRVRFDDKDAIWRGERRLLLNKHPFENSRVRNRLSMDLMSELPYLESMRTQFVNLWIDTGQGAQDKGIFTHVEAPGGRWLERRGFSKDDGLYKAQFFRFFADERGGLQLDENGEPLNEDVFEDLLEIENGDDHGALQTMMAAMHDPSIDFETVLDRHFNRNNILVWLATNILLHQTDGVTHNYLLHNPTGTERFYFVPWDYDGTLFAENVLDPTATDNDSLGRRLYYGYARNVNNALIARFLALPGTHDKLVQVAQWLSEQYLTPANIDAKATEMVAAIDPYRAREPDSLHYVDGTAYRPTDPTRFSANIAVNLEALRTRFSVPMPPTLQDPEREGNQWRFVWTPALEVTGNAVSYDLQVSRTTGFAPADIVHAATGIPDAQGTVEHRVAASLIPAGEHFVRVVARAANDPATYWQVPTNLVDEGGQTWFGMVRFGAP